jgi:molecular chaperone GrpE
MAKQEKPTQHPKKDEAKASPVAEPKAEPKQDTPVDPKDETIKDLICTLQRVQADFENYKKRIEREKSEFAKFACDSVVLDLLSVLDNFELVLSNKDRPSDFIKGVDLIYSELFTLLENKGLKRMETLGKKFDPYYHEALMQDKKEGTAPGIVIEEFQKGYMLCDRVIRFAKVKISR